MADGWMRVMALTALAMGAFASNSVLCRMALAQTRIDPAVFTLVRLASGACVLSLLVAASGRRFSGSWAGATALLGYAACFSFAYVNLAAGTGALLLFGAVQMTMIASGFARGERLGRMQVAGLVAALVGLAVLLAPGVAAPPPGAAALMVAAGVAWGAYSLLGIGGTDPLATTAGNFLRAAPMAMPLLLLVTPVLDGAGLIYAVLSGAVASGLGYAIWYAALPGLRSAQAASIQLSVPVLTAVSGTVWLGESVSLRLIVASLTVLGGIALVVRGRAVAQAS